MNLTLPIRILHTARFRLLYHSFHLHRLRIRTLALCIPGRRMPGTRIDNLIITRQIRRTPSMMPNDPPVLRAREGGLAKRRVPLRGHVTAEPRRAGETGWQGGDGNVLADGAPVFGGGAF